jgi:hypothetical protein
VKRRLGLLELDRLDANLAAVRARLKPPQRLRLVTKSLPSQLILYALERSGASGLLVFHAPIGESPRPVHGEGGRGAGTASSARFASWARRIT